MSQPVYRRFFETIWRATGVSEPPDFGVTGEGGFTSAFAVTDLAIASVGAAGSAIAEFIRTATGQHPETVVDRRLASLWFGVSIHPQGWKLPPTWDAVAGDYRTPDGWIRLHTNAPHHRAAALRVLKVEADRGVVAQAVLGWKAEALETAVVAAGGCAAAMRSVADWAAHPQGRAVASEKLVARTRFDGAEFVPDFDPSRPLAGLRVLDLTRVLAGPVATRFLAGFGAEVLRIDPPDWNEPSIEPDVTLGKACARLDLRDPAAADHLRTLLASADVLIHGYRPGALDGLGLGEAERRRIRPGLVDVSLDAYGWTGPWSGRRGFDSLVQMSAGIAEAGMRWAAAEKPTPLPVQALDHATGYILATAAIRGLTDRMRDLVGSTARASLARTAALLTSIAAPSAETLASVTDADLSPNLEDTEWGPAKRLRPPVSVGATTMQWTRPACSLGSAKPYWPG